MDDDAYFGRAAEEDARSQEDVGADSPGQHEADYAQGLEDVPADSDANTARLTLVDIERLTGISYVTLQRYAQSHNDRLPHEGTGRTRRYYPAAVEEFQKIKAEIAERRKGAGAGSGARTGTVQRQQGIVRRSHSRPRKKRVPKRTAATAASPRMPLSPLASPKKAQTDAGAAEWSTGAPMLASTSSSADLNRLAHTYQLTLQLKTLDAVQEFVSEWRTKLEAELATLKGV